VQAVDARTGIAQLHVGVSPMGETLNRKPIMEEPRTLDLILIREVHRELEYDGNPMKVSIPLGWEAYVRALPGWCPLENYPNCSKKFYENEIGGIERSRFILSSGHDGHAVFSSNGLERSIKLTSPKVL
jgi:hypothetical protein